METARPKKSARRWRENFSFGRGQLNRMKRNCQESFHQQDTKICHRGTESPRKNLFVAFPCVSVANSIICFAARTRTPPPRECKQTPRNGSSGIFRGNKKMRTRQKP